MTYEEKPDKDLEDDKEYFRLHVAVSMCMRNSVRIVQAWRPSLLLTFLSQTRSLCAQK